MGVGRSELANPVCSIKRCHQDYLGSYAQFQSNYTSGSGSEQSSEIWTEQNAVRSIKRMARTKQTTKRSQIYRSIARTKKTAKKKKEITESIAITNPTELEIDTEEDEYDDMDTTEQDRTKRRVLFGPD
ncbi:hypothetical protein NPIL_326031 [Nephila pilipes]|uniref:Uncharacterized protein n=1 Tax=Nephila pilipes TaxID=299642 RepID=A0A8X6R0V9_NEPPI|nr:hypothetical protein NPIL_439601 [Nephila pilipes]GFU60358.1 hypothetical protein NPIL_326031 [Nephila pilipes]